MIIIGGTYNEICFEPRWEEKYGSGLRACRVIQSLDPKADINFHTFGDNKTQLYLKQLQGVFPTITMQVSSIKHSMSFYYDYPLITPRIYPRLDRVDRQNNVIQVEGENILYFGLIEGAACVGGNKVIYDPQSPSNPIAFSLTGSTAKELIIVVNFKEASILAGSAELESMRSYFLEKEKAQAVIIKRGAQGAVILQASQEDIIIPVYETPLVWPIGSGDVFAASLAYHWFAGVPIRDAAEKASMHTAIYCSSKRFDFTVNTKQFKPLRITSPPKGKVYLAGPFFTFAERWLIDQIRSSLEGTLLDVFSPWHDIGHGIASDVVPQDLDALCKAQLVFAVVDGLDSGTLFEVGYAVARNIPVIAYVENETEESVKMLEGTACIIEKDLTTAIYRSLWTLAQYE